MIFDPRNREQLKALVGASDAMRNLFMINDKLLTDCVLRSTQPPTVSGM